MWGWLGTTSITYCTQYQVDPSSMPGLGLISIIHQGVLADPGRAHLTLSSFITNHNMDGYSWHDLWALLFHLYRVSYEMINW